jgi:RNA polymerase sigma factor (sigma-70 family)
MNSPTVAALERLAAGRDQQAWDVLVQLHGERIYAVAYRVTGEGALADDAAQETFLFLRRHAQRFRAAAEHPEAAAGAWIARAACFCALNLMRGRRRRGEHERKYAEERPMSATDDTADHDSIALMRRELAQLPRQDRDSLALHFFAGYDYERLSKECGVSINAARVRIHRALERLGSRLKKIGVVTSVTAIAGELQAAATPAVPPASMQHWQVLLGSSLHPSVSSSVVFGGLPVLAKSLIAAVLMAAVTIPAVVVAQSATAADVKPLQIAVDRVEAERSANRAAYERDYLPVKVRLEKDCPGKWIVIAGGEILRDNDTIKAFASVEAADFIASKRNPLAKHRYVFQVGNDGDSEKFLGGSGCRYIVGAGFLTETKRFQTGPAGVSVTKSNDPDEKEYVNFNDSGMIGRGLFIFPMCANPNRTLCTQEDFQIASGFEGNLVFPPSLADDLQLEQWEIPGAVHIEGKYAKDTCRRANMRVQLDQIGLDQIFPVEIWSIEGRVGRAISSGRTAEPFGPEVTGIRARMKLARHEFSVGENIRLRYVLKNVSESVIEIHPYKMRIIDVRDDTGTSVGKREQGELGENPDDEHRVVPPKSVLEPGEEDDCEITDCLLNRIWDLSKPGTYQVTFHWMGSGTTGNLKFPPLQFTITP